MTGPGNPLDLTLPDLTPGGATKRARRHLTEAEAGKYMNGDWRMRVVKYALSSLFHLQLTVRLLTIHIIPVYGNHSIL
jgi:hypothetical protein